MQEYRLDIKVRNNLILSRIESLGYKSIYEFCIREHFSYSRLINIVNMKVSIYNSYGEVRVVVHKLCERLKCCPDDLFTESQMYSQLETNKFTVQVKEAELKYYIENNNEQKLLEEIVQDEQKNILLENHLDKLTERERLVIKMRFGLEGEPCTLGDIGKLFNINSERVRQIQERALRKLRINNGLRELND